MTTTDNVLIRASAGTGKTFALSSRYIRLLLLGAPAESILATTFTRKAAGEILERVLLRLSEAAIDEDKAVELADHIGLERPLTAGECQVVLHGLVAELHQIRISTLDAFFARLGQAYALELRLPAGWRILETTEQTSLRLASIDRLLTAIGPTAAASLLHMLEKGSTTRSVSQKMLDAVGSFLSAHQQAQGDPWNWLPQPPSVSPAEVSQACDALDEQAEVVDDKRLQKALRSVAAAGRIEDFEAVLQSTLVRSALDGSHLYYTKPTPEEIRAELILLGRAAVAQVLQQLKSQTESTGELLTRFAAIYDDEKRQLRGLEFDDVTRSLAGAGADPTAMGYRLDGEIDHLLLDEFQDTSFSQWDVLRPIAQSAASGGGSVFCVGDVKQAIYGWRGGVAAIFDAFHDAIDQLTVDTLDASYRSSEVVIDFVNAVFGSVGQLSDRDFSGQAAIETWTKAFQTHQTNKELGGYASVVCMPEFGDTGEDDEPVDQQAERLNWVADLIAERHARRPTASIGVLVRTKAELVRVAAFVRARGIDVSEEGGQPMTDSAAVLLMLDLLKLVNHPGDTTARFKVAHSPLAEPAELATHADADAAARLSQRLRVELADEPLAVVVRRWARELVPSCGPRDLSRLRQLVRLAREHDAEGSGDVDAFLTLVRQTDRGAASAAAVRVMTVHASKGLEFDTAILLELDKPLASPSRSGYAASRPRPTSRPNRLVRYVNRTTQRVLPPSVREVYDEAAELEVVEGLCLFYVAVTRAKREVLCLVKPRSESSFKGRSDRGTIPSRADVLAVTLNGGQPFAADTVGFECGDRDWVLDDRSLDETLRRVPETIAIRLPPADRITRDRVRRSPSQSERLDPTEPIEASNRESDANGSNPPERVRLSQRLRAVPGGLATARGTLLHRWLEEVCWIEDGIATDERLTELANYVDGPPSLTRPAISDFREILDSPVVRRRLTRQASICEVLREHPFAVPIRSDSGSPGLLTGSIDRLELHSTGPDQPPSAATIIDWKTDRVRSEDELTDRIDGYLPQMAAYRYAVARQFELPADAVRVAVVFISVDRDHEYPAAELDEAWATMEVPAAVADS